MALVMFDLDGTLMDTAGEISEATNRTLADFGLAPVSQEEVRDWIGYGTGWLMRQAWTQADGKAKESDWDSVMQRFIGHYYDCAGLSSRPYPYVSEALEELTRLGIKCAIVTNKEKRFTDRIIEKHAMTQIFSLVVCGDTLEVKKPNPAVIQYCLDTLGQAPGESLFVGDSEIDVQTARAAGVTCWAVNYGYNMGNPIESAQPDLVVPDVRGVPGFFKGLA